MKLSQFSYQLPASAIAHAPAQPRDSARLLVIDRESGDRKDAYFRDLPLHLPKNAVLIRNNTKVIPARIYGRKETGGLVEILLIKRLDESNGTTWECLTKPGLKPGQKVLFSEKVIDKTGDLNTVNDVILLTASCQKSTETTRLMTFSQSGTELLATLATIGHTPTPPYIKWQSGDETVLRKVYQTQYAKIEGSAAAPTAGLHFTKTLDENLRKQGIDIVEVTLHVGLGTFMRVKTESIDDHTMHSEWYELTEATARFLTKARSEGRPLIAVGTTSARVLETIYREHGKFIAQSGETRLFVHPPSIVGSIDGLITNFHEPQSTLLMLVSALCSYPNTTHHFQSFLTTTVGKAYLHAIENNYRFLSFGDGMLIK